MPLDNQINITVTGKNEASDALHSVTADIEDLKQRVAEANKAASPLGEDMVVDTQAAKTEIGGLEAAFAGVAEVGGAAVAGISAAIGALVAVIGAAVVAVGGLVAAMQTVYDSAAGWENMVDQLQQVTGVSAEAASAMGYIAVVAGKSPAAIEQSMVTNSRIISAAMDAQTQNVKQASEAQARYDAQAAEQSAAHLEQQSNDAQAHADRIASIHKSQADQIAAYDERQADRDADRRRQDLRDAEAHQQRMADMAERHSANLASLNQSLADQQEAQATRAEDRARRLAEQLESFDDKSADRRLSIQMRLASARDSFERDALQGQLDEFDAQTSKERQKLVDKAAEEERRAKAEDDKALKRIEARIAAENAAFDRQVTRQDAAFAKAEQEKQASYDRDTQRQERAQAKQLQNLTERLAAEEQSYGRMAAARERSFGAAQAKQDKALQDHLKKLQEDVPPVVKAFEQMGIRFEDLVKLKPEDQFAAIASGINNVQDADQKLDLLNRIYGRGGWKNMMEIIEVMGTRTMPQWRDAVRDAGLESTEAEKNGFRDFQRGMREINLQLEGVKRTIGVDLLPVFQELLAAFQSFWKEHGKEVSAWLVKAVREWIPNMVIAIERIGMVANKVADSALFKWLFWFMEQQSNIARGFRDLGDNFARTFGIGRIEGSGSSLGPNLTQAGFFTSGVPASTGSTTTDPAGDPIPANGKGGTSGNTKNGTTQINITNNYPSPPITKDEGLQYYLYSLGVGGRR